jgi:hypothetical protein
MKCPKCGHLLEVERTLIENDYCEVIFKCTGDTPHRYQAFVDKPELEDYDDD